MPLLFKDFKKIVAPYAGRAGKCASSDDVSVFARLVMENLLFSGSYAGIKKVNLLAHRGLLSLPPDIEVPIKVRIGNRVANVWNKWISFHDVDENFSRCANFGEVLEEDGELTPLAYQLPCNGSVVGVMGTCEEQADSFVIVQGTDMTGREIYTTYQGEKVVGEKFKIVKNEVRFGGVRFGKITGVTKPETNGYVQLVAVDEVRQVVTQFLADYSPSEKRPLYRLFRLRSRSCHEGTFYVSMLARMRLKDSYHDEELTLFDNSMAVLLAAQKVQSEVNSDANIANYKQQALTNALEKEASFKRAPTGGMDVFFPLSGGAIRRIV